jgi:hypothetical protein
LYATTKKDTILKQVCQVIEEKKKKLVQFSICFHTLVESRPMIDYESMSKFLHFLDVKNFPKTDWSNING